MAIKDSKLYALVDKSTGSLSAGIPRDAFAV